MTELKSDIWFPTIIWSTELDNIDLDAIKNFAYDLKSNSKGKVASNHLGWQSESFTTHIPVVFDSAVEQIDAKVFEATKGIGLPCPFLTNMWININTPNSYNHIHTHSGSFISGVYYIDVEEDNMGDIEFYRNDESEYYIPKNIPINQFTALKTKYTAKTNTMYLFPSWLRHSVLSNQNNKDRISISFNYGYPK